MRTSIPEQSKSVPSPFVVDRRALLRLWTVPKPPKLVGWLAIDKYSNKRSGKRRSDSIGEADVVAMGVAAVGDGRSPVRMVEVLEANGQPSLRGHLVAFSH
jgi:hypothetical protein